MGSRYRLFSWPSRSSAGLLALGLLFGAVPGQSPAQAGTAPTAQAQPVAGTVTLLTGDQVRLTALPGGHRTVSVRPGPGRESVAFYQRTSGDRLLVIPSDASRLVASGALDQQLFDVAGLLRDGYGDAADRQLPLVLGYRDGASAARARPAFIGSTTALNSIDAVALQQPKRTAGRLWRQLTGASGGGARGLAGGVRRVWLDGLARVSLDQTVPQVGADQAWRAGFTGQGVPVAVLDTGVRADHPDLRDVVAQARDFTGSEAGTDDRNGHGTHVASVIAGSGAASGARYRGVAPGARLLVGKVFDAGGSGRLSQVIAGMEWAAGEAGARVVNLSLGSRPSSGTDPLSLAVNKLTASTGALFVVAAGNDGAESTVSAPASADAALAVASVTKADRLSPFSSRGPRYFDRALKPEIVAPGSDVVAARAKGTPVGDRSPVGEAYTRLSGTSMATPHVAAAAAILAQARPQWRAAQLKAALVSTSRVLPGIGLYGQGAGRLDLARAVGQSVVAETVGVDLRTLRWPHETRSDGPVIYRNLGGEPVTLTLQPTLTGPDGKPAPAGLLTLDATQVTVAAGASARVPVSVQPTRATPPGDYTGRILATGPSGLQVNQPVSFHVETESYDVTVRGVRRDGRPADEGEVGLAHAVSGAEPLAWPDRQDLVLRTPKGGYRLFGVVTEDTAGTATGRASTLFADPDLVVDGDATVTFDARRARPVTSTSPAGPKARPEWRQVYLGGRSRAPQELSVILFDEGSANNELYAVPAPGRYDFRYFQSLAEPPGEPDARAYSLFRNHPGGIPAEPTVRFTAADLATVATSFAGQSGARTGTLVNAACLEPYPSCPASNAPIVFPGRRLVHYTADQGLTWAGELSSFVGDPVTERRDEDLRRPRLFRAGQRYTEEWNTAPLSPTAEYSREPGRLSLSVTPFTSSRPAGAHRGPRNSHEPLTGTMALSRDGRPLGTAATSTLATFAVPDGAGRYQLAVDADRDSSFSVLGSRLHATWAFTVPAAADTGPVRDGLPRIRLTGDLDELNRAPAGRAFELTVHTETFDGARPVRARQLTLAASFDDGSSWRPVRLVRAGPRWRAVVDHPAAGSAKFVSLRATGTGLGGADVAWTVLRAYGLR